MMRMFFRSILLILCLVLFTSGANTATHEFAGKYERDRPRETVSRGIIGTPNSPLRVCETKRPADPPQRDAGKAGTKSSTTKTASGVAMKFTRLSVIDPLAGNIEAVSFLIPAGWKAEGGVQWYPNHAIQANLLMKIVDPQTGAAIEFLPAQWFSWPAAMVVPMPQGSNYLGQIIWPPIYDVPEFIRTFYFSSALARLQNSKIVADEN